MTGEQTEVVIPPPHPWDSVATGLDIIADTVKPGSYAEALLEDARGHLDRMSENYTNSVETIADAHANLLLFGTRIGDPAIIDHALAHLDAFSQFNGLVDIRIRIMMDRSPRETTITETHWQDWMARAYAVARKEAGQPGASEADIHYAWLGSSLAELAVLVATEQDGGTRAVFASSTRAKFLEHMTALQATEAGNTDVRIGRVAMSLHLERRHDYLQAQALGESLGDTDAVPDDFEGVQQTSRWVDENLQYLSELDPGIILGSGSQIDRLLTLDWPDLGRTIRERYSEICSQVNNKLFNADIFAFAMALHMIRGTAIGPSDVDREAILGAYIRRAREVRTVLLDLSKQRAVGPTAVPPELIAWAEVARPCLDEHQELDAQIDILTHALSCSEVVGEEMLRLLYANLDSQWGQLLARRSQREVVLAHSDEVVSVLAAASARQEITRGARTITGRDLLGSEYDTIKPAAAYL